MKLNNLNLALEAIWYYITNRKERLPELSHTAISLRSCVRNLLLNNLAEKRIKSGESAGTIWLIVALPKSASSVIGSMLGILAKERGLQGRKYADYMSANQDSNLRPELLRSFPMGGVLKFHPWPKANNLRLIEKLSMKVVLTLRHPADQIVAFLEHSKKQGLGKVVNPAGLIRDHLYSIWQSEISEGVEKSISFLIKSGYLLNTLMFVTEWLRYREYFNISVLSFEEMVENRTTFYKRLEQIAGVPINEKIKSDLDSIASRRVKRG